jgi:hypothetical protein
MKDFGPAFGVANAVLYEGYLLFPYTVSTQKNRVRWQFGVVVPRAYLAAETGEHADCQTEVLFESDAVADIDVLLRFLQVEARFVEVRNGDRFESAASFALEGTTYLTFDEAVEREALVNIRPDGELRQSAALRFEGGRDIEELRDRAGIVRARIVRQRWPLRGSLTIDVDPQTLIGNDAGTRISKLRVRVENDSDVVPGERSAALRTALVSTHVLLAVDGGRFLSVLDPPGDASQATAALDNRQTFPVLIGDARSDARRASLVLSSPIILYDFPALGAQTDADTFDATEIDELLTLTVLSLSDEERAEARATDPRARAIVERAERFGAEAIARIHAGSLQRAQPDTPALVRLANPFADGGPDGGFPGDPLLALDVPSIDCVFIADTKVARGSSVRLHPKGRADIWDSVLDGRLATVRAIHQDLEDKMYVAVTVDDDPASDLHDWYGRSFFFSPDEVEPLVGGSVG